jgi:hypothetical protein
VIRTLQTFTLFLSLGAALGWQPALAEGKWSAGLHLGNVAVDRLVEDSGSWWSQVDDGSAAYGLSLAYEHSSLLGLRLMYERAGDLVAENRCPPGQACPAVAFDEEQDFTAWQIAAVPRLALGPDWSLFGTLGAMRWKLDRDDVLPGDSGTEFVYGLGLAWRGQRLEMGAEYQRAGIDLDAFRVSLGLRF